MFVVKRLPQVQDRNDTRHVSISGGITKMFYTPDGNAENRQEVARWCSTNWTYIFNGTMTAKSAMWREVKQNWLELIETRREEERDFVEESEEEARRSGTDGEGTSGGDVEARAFFQRWV